MKDYSVSASLTAPDLTPVTKINAPGGAMHLYCQCMGEVSTSATP